MNIMNHKFLLFQELKIQVKIYYVELKSEYQKKRPLWNFKQSQFKDWKLDTQELNLQCFEEDWKTCKIQKLIKD